LNGFGFGFAPFCEWFCPICWLWFAVTLAANGLLVFPVTYFANGFAAAVLVAATPVAYFVNGLGCVGGEGWLAGVQVAGGVCHCGATAGE